MNLSGLTNGKHRNLGIELMEAGERNNAMCIGTIETGERKGEGRRKKREVSYGVLIHPGSPPDLQQESYKSHHLAFT